MPIRLNTLDSYSHNKLKNCDKTMIELVALKTCFECKNGTIGTNDNGMTYVECSIYDSDHALYAKYDEALLPQHCGCFEYGGDECMVCGKKMKTVTYMNSIYGLIPICSQKCAKIQDDNEEDFIACTKSGCSSVW